MSVDMVETPDRPLRTPLNSVRTLRSSAMPRRRLALLGALWLAAGACASPVGAVRVDPAVAHRQLARSATTTGEPSWPTRNHLAEHDLLEAFDTQPEAAIAELHRAMVASGGDPGLLFALAELSFLYGQAAKNPAFYLAAAVYAYAFLFPEESGVTVGRFDPRLRIAADLYNLALAGAFVSKDRSEVVLRGGTFSVPFGRIEVAFDPASLRAGDRELYRFDANGGAGGARSGDALPVAGPRPPARRRHSTHRCRETRPGPGGAAPPGAGDGLPADPGIRRALVEGRPLAAHARAPPGLGRGGGLDRRRAGPARDGSLGGARADLHRRAHRAARAPRVPGSARRVSRGRRSSRSRPTGPGSSPSSSCTARSRAWSAGRRCTIASRAIPRSGDASSSGSSSTIPASPWRCPRSSYARP